MPKAASFSSSDRRRVSGAETAALPLAHHAQLILADLRQIFDLRHPRRPDDGLLGRGRNELLAATDSSVSWRGSIGSGNAATGAAASSWLADAAGGRIRLRERRASRAMRRERPRGRANASGLEWTLTCSICPIAS